MANPSMHLVHTVALVPVLQLAGKAVHPLFYTKKPSSHVVQFPFVSYSMQLSLAV